MIRISGIRIPINRDSPEELKRQICSRLGIRRKDLLGFQIFKKSVDARKKNMVYFVYTVDAAVASEVDPAVLNNDGQVSKTPDMGYSYVENGQEPLKERPVIVGTGPAGLFAGLILSEMGYSPLLLERGADAESRRAAVSRFWNSGTLDPECNVQFGEGGAGTFSDGKLTTQTRDTRNRKVLEEFVEAGAPEEILYSYRPHVGTDKLVTIVQNTRKKIIAAGGEVRFNSKLTDLAIEDGTLKGIVVNDTEVIPLSVLVLAIGHSSRDTYEMLYNRGVSLVQKAFSIGVRIEHPQELIDRIQYGSFAGHPKLGAADYKLAYHSPNGRTAYTFCMCPGGSVVAAASEPGYLCTNGMSEYARDGRNANSAFLVNVALGDFGSDHPLAGVQYQRKWEGLAYALGGGDYSAPVQLLRDFLKDRKSTSLGSVEPTYRPGVTLANLTECLPSFIVETLKEAVPNLDRKLKGFALDEAVLTGVETRSSSPVRILRDECFQSNISGLYPAGEGAGYSGGIVSSAVDGIKAAEAIARRYRPFS
ncbi:MAG: NAD(P)/FAD-dependent oxidoreductase [Bacillota bacterium]